MNIDDLITMTDESDKNVNVITLTENSVEKITELLKTSDEDYLRVFVSGGGCSGFQYGFAFDNEYNENDTLVEKEGVKVIVDMQSLELIKGCEIDYVKTLGSEAFSIKNPNAKSSCGCGKSFTPADDGGGCANA